MSSSKKSLLPVLAFIAMCISAVLWALFGMANAFDWKLNGKLISALQTIALFFSFIVVAFVAYEFTKDKSVAIKVIYWVMIVIFIASVVLGII